MSIDSELIQNVEMMIRGGENYDIINEFSPLRVLVVGWFVVGDQEEAGDPESGDDLTDRPSERGSSLFMW